MRLVSLPTAPIFDLPEPLLTINDADLYRGDGKMRLTCERHDA